MTTVTTCATVRTIMEGKSNPKPVAVIVDANGVETDRFKTTSVMQRGRPRETGRKDNNGNPVIEWVYRDCTEEWAHVPSWARPLILKALGLSVTF